MGSELNLMFDVWIEWVGGEGMFEKVCLLGWEDGSGRSGEGGGDDWDPDRPRVACFRSRKLAPLPPVNGQKTPVSSDQMDRDGTG